MRISVIVPVYNEAEIIRPFIAGLMKTAAGYDHEVIVVDGAPGGGTLKRVEEPEVIKIAARRGRGNQMNEGASAATGEVLLFLHADTTLPHNAFSAVTNALAEAKFVGGAFKLNIFPGGPLLGFISSSANLRARVARMPFGDQAIFIRKSYFDEIGGYKEPCLFEDLELMKRIRKLGGRITILGDPVATSSRRWQKEGVLYATLRNGVIRTLYRLGVTAETLEKYYAHT